MYNTYYIICNYIMYIYIYVSHYVCIYIYYCIILYYIIFYYIILYVLYILLYYIILCYVMLCYIISYYIIYMYMNQSLLPDIVGDPPLGSLEVPGRPWIHERNLSTTIYIGVPSHSVFRWYVWWCLANRIVSFVLSFLLSPQSYCQKGIGA